MPFRLAVGDEVPRQQSPVTCGSASLTVARMLANPDFAGWINDGVVAEGCLGLAAVGLGGSTRDARFAAYERIVHQRTSGVWGPTGRLSLPWPRALGTSPWGAARELENGIADPGTAYRLRWIRYAAEAGLSSAFDRLRATARRGRPALLYIGDRWIPRHVLLVIGPAGEQLEIYDPSVDKVITLDRARMSARRLRIAGWDVPWCTVEPTTD